MKRSTITVITSILLAATLTGCAASSNNKSSVHKVSTYRVNTNLLSNTVVIPTIDSNIMSGVNMIYCSTFQLAWNELKDNIIKEDIKLSSSPAVVESLNNSISSKIDISDKDYVAMAGFAKGDFINRINSTLKEKFKEDAPLVQANSFQPTDIFAYSFLYKNLRFKKEFESLQAPIQFMNGSSLSKVKGFGVGNYTDKTDHKAINSQIDIFDYKGNNNFIIKISTVSDNDEIVLAKIKPEISLQKTIESVFARINSSKAEKLLINDTLRIPKFDLNISHSYSELVRKAFLNSGFKEYSIIEARQDIMFLLDEKGAVLKSQAKIHASKSAEKFRQFIFDEPFLLYLKEKNGKYPYFALWVENSELMVNEK